MRVFGIVLALLGILVVEPAKADTFSISSPSFAPGKPMPARFSYKGGDVSPELDFDGVPAAAKSLVIIVDDPDSPSGLWTHWLLWNIPAGTKVIPEGKVPAGVGQGKNSFGHNRYDGPVPPSGTHRYFFRAYALDVFLKLTAGSERSALKQVLADPNRVVAKAEMYGTYSANP